MLFFVAIVVAVASGFCLQMIIRFGSDWARTGLALVGAALALAVFFSAFAADGITVAAAFTLSPLLFAILVIPSAIGVRLAGKPGSAK